MSTGLRHASDRSREAQRGGGMVFVRLLAPTMKMTSMWGMSGLHHGHAT
jgi:hypothetical protein